MPRHCTGVRHVSVGGGEHGGADRVAAARQPRHDGPHEADADDGSCHCRRCSGSGAQAGGHGDPHLGQLRGVLDRPADGWLARGRAGHRRADVPDHPALSRPGGRVRPPPGDGPCSGSGSSVRRGHGGCSCNGELALAAGAEAALRAARDHARRGGADRLDVGRQAAVDEADPARRLQLDECLRHLAVPLRDARLRALGTLAGSGHLPLHARGQRRLRGGLGDVAAQHLGAGPLPLRRAAGRRHQRGEDAAGGPPHRHRAGLLPRRGDGHPGLAGFLLPRPGAPVDGQRHRRLRQRRRRPGDARFPHPVVKPAAPRLAMVEGRGAGYPRPLRRHGACQAVGRSQFV
mmetsp:Transcript_59658/g.177510  ORF Transcript_59658/g.177510 Transcript_59658/m.177510 type:complete len:346 (+) Transcript_59658:284-1321(+)